VFFQCRGCTANRDIAFHRPGHVELPLGDIVVRIEVLAHVLGLIEDVHELHDQPVALLFERVVAPLGELDAVLDCHQVLPGWFNVLGHLLEALVGRGG